MAGLYIIDNLKKCNRVNEPLALSGLSPMISLKLADDTIHQKIKSTCKKLARDYHPDKFHEGKTVK